MGAVQTELDFRPCQKVKRLVSIYTKFSCKNGYRKFVVTSETDKLRNSSRRLFPVSVRTPMYYDWWMVKRLVSFKE